MLCPEQQRLGHEESIFLEAADGQPSFQTPLEAGLITKENWLSLPGRPVFPLSASLWTSEPLPHVDLCREETAKQKKKKVLEAERPRFAFWLYCLQEVRPSLLAQSSVFSSIGGGNNNDDLY